MSWTEFLEWLVPDAALRRSHAPKWDLKVARFFVFLLYVVLGGVFLYTLYYLLFAGRVEVVRQGYKVDTVEAPSVAICPFWPNMRISRPEGRRWAEGTRVQYTTLDGVQMLDVKPFACEFDRECVCVELFKKQDGQTHVTELNDYEGERSMHTGATGVESHREVKFRDRIEFRTNLTDPSGDETLKVGLFDSIDPSPNWFYVTQGSYVMGTLEIQRWTVTDMSLHALMRTFAGHWSAMARRRHIFRWVSNEVGKRGAIGRHWNETHISYEMHNFFIDETVSSETAWSGYTIMFLIFLVAIRAPIISTFLEVLLPKDDEGVLVDRQLAGWALGLGRFCGCCMLHDRHDEEEGETQALVK